MLTFEEMKEYIEVNGGTIEDWEYTSNGYRVSFKFEDIFWNHNCAKIQAIKYDLKLAHAEVIDYSYNVLSYDDDEQTYTVLHDMEIML